MHPDDVLEPIGDPLFAPDLKLYLSTCLPPEVLIASGVRVFPLGRILDEIHPGSAPGSYFHRYDYLPIASSVGGNLIVVHAWGSQSSRVYWADHTGWSDDLISYEDRQTGTWIDLEGYTPENVERALVPLSKGLWGFLVNLLDDQLEEQLDSLD